MEDINKNNITHLIDELIKHDYDNNFTRYKRLVKYSTSTLDLINVLKEARLNLTSADFNEIITTMLHRYDRTTDRLSNMLHNIEVDLNAKSKELQD